MSDSYKTVSGFFSSEIVVKKSRFICSISYSSNEKDASLFVDEIKKQYKDARHNVWAFNLYPYLCRYNDDKEPKGTAGPFVLDALQKNEIYDVSCVVTRYFGGTLLGASLLSRTYSDAVIDCLNKCEIKNVYDCFLISISFSYSLYGFIENLLKCFKHKVESSNYTEDINLKLILKKCDYEDFKNEILNITNGECVIDKLDEYRCFI